MHKWADSKKIIKELEKNLEDEMYLTRQLDKARDTLVERIKGLENDLTTFIDEVNRLTAINEELEQKQMKLNGQCIEYIRKIDKLEQELKRYKEFIHEIKVWDWSSTNSALNLFNRIKEFEEAKE